MKGEWIPGRGSGLAGPAAQNVQYYQDRLGNPVGIPTVTELCGNPLGLLHPNNIERSDMFIYHQYHHRRRCDDVSSAVSTALGRSSCTYLRYVQVA